MCLSLAIAPSYQAVEKGPSASSSLRSTPSLQRTTIVRLRSSVLHAPRIWGFLNGLKMFFLQTASISSRGLFNEAKIKYLTGRNLLADAEALFGKFDRPFHP